MTFAPAGFSERLTPMGLVMTRGDIQLRFVARMRPLSHPHDVLAGIDVTARRSEPRAVSPSCTSEGELALRTGDLVEGSIARELAMIVGDDFAAVVIGVAPVAQANALAMLVDDLARDTRLGLGTRRRRYLYTPPPGWQRVSLDGMDVHFLAPGHPRSPGCLTVYAAIPGDSEIATWWDKDAQLVVGGARFDQVPLFDEDLVIGGLDGRRVRLAGCDAERDLVAELWCLVDRQYTYRLALVSDAVDCASRLDAMNEIVASIQPLAMRPPALHALAALEHWCA
ncbi:MAG: hypothetical protein ACKV2T_22440 [Kofleriaceae bacterium]